MTMRRAFLLALTAVALSACATTEQGLSKPDPKLASIVANPARTATAIARDPARRPLQTLTYFGLKPNMSVVELWPGLGYWTEILGPYLRDRGRYYVAQPINSGEFEDRAAAGWQKRVDQQRTPLGLGDINVTHLGPRSFDIAPAGTVDLVLTFRNLHNWMSDGIAADVFASVFRALKPGGILAIEEHRARTDVPQDPKASNGYVREDYTIALARAAGFEFVSSSEINANPRDTKDWVEGVWTLPPTLTQGDKDRARYLAIGEADNFLLKFRKPRR
jgi:predicted methyltransferase